MPEGIQTGHQLASVYPPVEQGQPGSSPSTVHAWWQPVLSSALTFRLGRPNKNKL